LGDASKKKEYFWVMFIRRKKNRSGSISIVVIDKGNGKFREVTTIGTSSDASELEKLYVEGKRWIASTCGNRDMFAEHDRSLEEKQVTEHLLSNIENILLNGTQLILNPVFELTGFNKIDDEILKHLVVSRICQPRSKVATVDYLKSYYDGDVALNKIYRYLDKLHNTQQEKIQQISVEHTRKILGGKIGLVFYDVTTLYFETDSSDELRERGFSKDGRHAQPQVVLGLLVSAGGYPLSYSLFNGSQYEGRTMIPIVEDFVKRFSLEDFVVVADSGLINKTNMALLESEGYKYIIGARIKNETDEIKQWILSLEKYDGCFYELGKMPHSRLIVGYSENRAKKERYNREKGVKRLQKAYKSGQITKENINKRGYNKFLKISDHVKVEIDTDKIREDAQWDGLKGYLTNTKLPAEEVYGQYSGLWQVERAFRITKGTLELRPMFHFTPKRIEAHVCICFVAYKIYKEFERILRIKGIDMSVDKVLDIAKTITTLKIRLPLSNEILTKTMFMTQKHLSIAQLFNKNFWQNL
jgi:transposase